MTVRIVRRVRTFRRCPQFPRSTVTKEKLNYLYDGLRYVHRLKRKYTVPRSITLCDVLQQLLSLVLRFTTFTNKRLRKFYYTTRHTSGELYQVYDW